jgi:hypothetical protein
MNKITNYERIVTQLPKSVKKSFVAQIKRDRLTITEALKRMVFLYLDGETQIVEKGRFK